MILCLVLFPSFCREGKGPSCSFTFWLGQTTVCQTMGQLSSLSCMQFGKCKRTSRNMSRIWNRFPLMALPLWFTVVPELEEVVRFVLWTTALMSSQTRSVWMCRELWDDWDCRGHMPFRLTNSTSFAIEQCWSTPSPQSHIPRNFNYTMMSTFVIIMSPCFGSCMFYSISWDERFHTIWKVCVAFIFFQFCYNVSDHTISEKLVTNWVRELWLQVLNSVQSDWLI